MGGLLQPGPTLAAAEELRSKRGSRGLLEAVGTPLSYAPIPAVSMIGQGLLGAQYLTGEKELGQGLASLSDMTAMMVGSRLPPAMRHLFAGVNAKTADKVKLAEAEALDKQGVDNRTIWQKTGWFKSPDGKWRFEVDDTSAFKPGIGVDDETHYKTFGETLYHPGLRKAYPDLNDMDTVTGKAAQGMGSFTEATPGTRDYFGSSAEISALAPNRQELKKSLLHEMQHAVQTKEGFHNGGNPNTILSVDVAPQYRSALQQAESIKDEEERIKAATKAYKEGRFDAYLRLAGEAEARAVESRMNLTKKQRGLLFPLDSYDVPLDRLIVR